MKHTVCSIRWIRCSMFVQWVELPVCFGRNILFPSTLSNKTISVSLIVSRLNPLESESIRLYNFIFSEYFQITNYKNNLKFSEILLFRLTDFQGAFDNTAPWSAIWDRWHCDAWAPLLLTRHCDAVWSGIPIYGSESEILEWQNLKLKSLQVISNALELMPMCLSI